MDKDSNKATFLFSSAMVVVVATLLSIAAVNLGPRQAKNIRIEKMKNILYSISVDAESGEAEHFFSRYVIQQIVLNHKGEDVAGRVAAFDIDLKKELDKIKAGKFDEQLFPLFICKKEGKLFYIIPVYGKGLWGPIWGYISLEGDMNTIYGVSFGHKSETPGLGAEIETHKFQNQFIGKKIFDETEKFVSVSLVKGGASPSDTHAVDAISGATITSKGVTEMLRSTLGKYTAYFKSKKLQN